MGPAAPRLAHVSPRPASRRTARPTLRDHEATLAIGAGLDDVADSLRWVDHTPIRTEASSCLVTVRSEDLGRLAMTFARIALTAPVEVVEPAELAATIRQLATHLDVSPLQRTAECLDLKTP